MGASMVRSIRLLRPKQWDDLHKYVFADFAHARTWLLQPFVARGGYTLEEVEVGEMCRCTRCDGSGYTQTVKPVRKLTVDEFLREAANGK